MADHPFTGTLSVTDKVGIGIDEPIAQLHIASSTSAPSQAFLESGGALLKLSVDASGTSIGTANAFPLSIQTDGTPRITINSAGHVDISAPLSVQNTLTISGNVGIGTTASNHKLAIAAGDINIDDSRALRQAGRWVIGGDSNVLGIGSSNAPDGRDIRFDPGFAGALTIKKDTGNVGIGTTNPTYKLEVVGDVKASSIHSKPKVFEFKVEGDFDKFYPIVFHDNTWWEGPIILEINRPSIHTDSTSRGSLNSRFTTHSSWWGNGANFCRSEIYSLGNQFIAGYENYYFIGRFVIWLRGGGTTYFWRSNHFVSLEDYSAKEKIVKYNNDDRTAVTYPVKTNIESYVLNNGISFDQNFVVQGNVGIGTTSPNFGLDVRGNNHWIGSGDSSQSQGGWRLGRWPDYSPNEWVYLSRADSTGRYQDLAVGALWAGGTLRFGTADDLAEMTPVKAEDNLEPGDVVVIENPLDNRVLLARSNKPYDSKVAGVISDPSTAGLIIGGSHPTDVNRDDIKPLALAGRVLTKVTTENGSINAGDFLTTSSTPGHAMKAIVSGHTLGKALQSFNDDQNGENKEKIWVLVNLGMI
jgi:hypothetical protein